MTFSVKPKRFSGLKFSFKNLPMFFRFPFDDEVMSPGRIVASISGLWCGADNWCSPLIAHVCHQCSSALHCSSLVIAHVCRHHEKIPRKPPRHCTASFSSWSTMGKATHGSALCCKEKTKGSPKTPPIREIWGYRANTALKNGWTVHTWCLRPHKCAQQIHHSKSSPLQCLSLYAHWNRRGVRPVVWDQCWCHTSGVRP